MPLNGKATPVSKPSWLKDSTAAPTTPAARPSWARKTPEAKKEDSPTADAKVSSKITAKKEPEAPKKEVTTRLQSREIKVPLKVEKTVPTQSILKKPDVKIKQDLKEEKTTLPFRDSKTPSKSPSKTPASSKSPSTTPSKSPSKTPDYDSDDSDESSYETETDTDETESEDDDFSVEEKPSHKPPAAAPKKPDPKRSTSPDYSFTKPALKKVVTRQKSDAKERSTSPEPKFLKPNLRKVPSSLKIKEPPPREKLPVVDLKKIPAKPEPEMKLQRKNSEVFPHKPSILRDQSNKKIPLPPPPPPPPPPPGLRPPPDFEKKPISQKHRETLEKLKTRPRRRPDWSEMMKEVEEMRSGKKLRKVQCNDRSSPIITCKSMAKVQGQYVFETEKKPAALDKLLNEIQGGIKLKPTKTNDRSKPILDGLRKFRRQMTIEEQIMKSESKAMLAENPDVSPIVDDEEDELDDIDKVRDDLQSTKQMLALELRNKEAQERENKRLMSKIANLEAELERERQRVASGGGASEASAPASDDAVVKSLKKEAEEAQKTSKLLEKKYQDVAEQLDNVQKEVEEKKRLIANLERQLQIYEDGWSYNYVFEEGGGGNYDSRRQSEAVQQKESSPEMELVLSEEEEDETDEQKAERAARRLKREVDMLKAKLTKLKDKESSAKSERKSLRDAMKKNQQQLKSEKKNLKKLQKEVEKMAKMMQAVEDEDDDGDNEEKAAEEESEEESEESEQESEESESEESDSETESQSEDEDADDDKKKSNLEPRVKRHDGRLSSLKKGNYLLEANVERLKDEIKDIKEKCEALQADLNSVIDLC